MSLSQRDRRDWRIILWVSLASAAVSAWFGVLVAPAAEWWLRSATHGIVKLTVFRRRIKWPG